MTQAIELMRQVLDHEIVDSNNTSCGMVDNIEFVYTPGKAAMLTALLVGPGAWAPRLPSLFCMIAERLFGRTVLRVPIEEVIEVRETIRLKSSAAALGLGRIDRKVGKWVSRLPKS